MRCHGWSCSSKEDLTCYSFLSFQSSPSSYSFVASPISISFLSFLAQIPKGKERVCRHRCHRRLQYWSLQHLEAMNHPKTINSFPSWLICLVIQQNTELDCWYRIKHGRGGYNSTKTYRSWLRFWTLSTIQGEKHKITQKWELLLTMLSTPYELQIESQLSWITLSGTPLKATEQEAQRDFLKNLSISLLPYNPKNSEANDLPKILVAQWIPQSFKRDSSYLWYSWVASNPYGLNWRVYAKAPRLMDIVEKVGWLFLPLHKMHQCGLRDL